jgi:hypothetical protein
MEKQTKEKVEFLDFLERKNIDAEAFKSGNEIIYEDWVLLFGLVSEASFVLQQKFLINPIRRKYPKKVFK